MYTSLFLGLRDESELVGLWQSEHSTSCKQVAFASPNTARRGDKRHSRPTAWRVDRGQQQHLDR